MRRVVKACVVGMLFLFPGSLSGNAAVQLHPTPRIVGGQPTDPNEYRWTVAVYPVDDPRSLCGGTLVARDWVLTAAHCFYDSENARYLDAAPAAVRVGSHRRTTGGRLHRVSAIHPHPEYDPDEDVNDVLLLKLAEAAPAELGAVTLPNEDVHHRVAVAGETEATALGWGVTGEIPDHCGPDDPDPSCPGYATTLREARLPLRPTSYCGEHLDPAVELCAGAPGRDSCRSNSGGPLIVVDQGAYYQIGVTSSGSSSCDGFGAYAKVAAFHDWIRQTIEDNAEPAEEADTARRARAMKYVLAAFGRTVATDMVDAIGERAGAARSPGGLHAKLAGKRLASGASGSVRPAALARRLERVLGAGAGGKGRRNPVRALSGTSFRLPFDGKDETAAGAGTAWTLWGRGAASGFEDRPDEDFSMDGKVWSGQTGIDFRTREDLLVGVAAGYSEGKTDYRAGEVEGKVDATLTSVHPYVHWSPAAGLGMWAALGYGWGKATLGDGGAIPVGTDIDLRMAAAGGRRVLAHAAGVDWALKTDGFLVRVRSEEREGLLPKTEADYRRMRLALEVRKGAKFAGGRKLSGSVELGGRLDGGDLESGAGLEVGGAADYADRSMGLDLKARGRFLAAHRASDLREWRASVTAVFDPGARGQGFYLSLAPSWGNASLGKEALWKGAWPAEARPNGYHMALKARSGYRMKFMDGRSRLTPFSELGVSDGPSKVRMGARLAMPSALPGLNIRFKIYGEQKFEAPGDASDPHAILESRVKRSFGRGLGAVEVFGKLRTGNAKGKGSVGVKASLRF